MPSDLRSVEGLELGTKPDDGEVLHSSEVLEASLMDQDDDSKYSEYLIVIGKLSSILED